MTYEHPTPLTSWKAKRKQNNVTEVTGTEDAIKEWVLEQERRQGTYYIQDPWGEKYQLMWDDDEPDWYEYPL
jgi:hypothetical protein